MTLSSLLCFHTSEKEISANIIKLQEDIENNAKIFADTHYTKTDMKTDFCSKTDISSLINNVTYVNLTDANKKVKKILLTDEVDSWLSKQTEDNAKIFINEYENVKEIMDQNLGSAKHMKEYAVPPSINSLINIANPKQYGTYTAANDDSEDKGSGEGGAGKRDEISSDTSAKHTAPIISKSNYQFWYGSVNCWSAKVGNKYVFEDQIPKLASIGCTGYHIEMFSWINSLNSISNIEAAYQKLISLCRQRKWWLFIDVINGNFNGSKTKWTAGMSNYSNLTVGYIVNNYGQKLIDIIKKYGPQNVIVQPIGEPGSKGQNSDCQKFQNMCCSQLTNYYLATEPNRSNSANMTKNTKYKTIHVSNSAKAIDENTTLVKGKNDGVGSWSSANNCDIVVSDTGTAIQVLASPEKGSQQGWLNKWTSACSRASRLTNAVKNYKGQCAVFVYYHFKFKCMGTNGSTIDGELNKGTWNNIKTIVNPKYS